jgi:hypothetical protein
MNELLWLARDHLASSRVCEQPSTLWGDLEQEFCKGDLPNVCQCGASLVTRMKNALFVTIMSNTLLVAAFA